MNILQWLALLWQKSLMFVEFSKVESKLFFAEILQILADFIQKFTEIRRLQRSFIELYWNVPEVLQKIYTFRLPWSENLPKTHQNVHQKFINPYQFTYSLFWVMYQTLMPQ